MPTLLASSSFGEAVCRNQNAPARKKRPTSASRESRQENEARQAQKYRDIESIYGSSSHAYWITILGSQHGNFADLAVLARQPGRAVGMLGPIDGRRGLRITSDYVRAFFDKYLMNAASPLLAGPSSEYPEVRFESH